MRPALVALIALAVAVAGCTGERPSLAPAPTTTATAPTTTAAATTAVGPSDASTTTTTPQPEVGVAAPDGRRYPAVATDPALVADRIIDLELLLRDTDPADSAYADLAHEQQMHYRHIGRNPEWLVPLWARVPDDLLFTVERHVTARQQIGGIPSGDPPVNVPAWEIVEPLPADELLGLYRLAASETGIDWTYLAAINLIETGYGRIRGVSTAGARGPMQFLPTTWEEVSDGDIDDPYDAIPAAARYLVRRGGPDDMQRALWGYNNTDYYVAAVSAYADLFRDDVANYHATHAWEIHYSAAIGDLWLPVGYRRAEAVPAVDHLDEAPWAAPPPGP